MTGIRHNILRCMALGVHIACCMAASADGDLNATEILGRAIYRLGQPTTTTNLTARIGADDLPASARDFPCGNCHREDGTGGREGTLNIPAIDWHTLTSLQQSSGKHRPAYDQASLVRVLRDGIDSNGERLDPAMPRYAMTQADFTALTAYLQRLGTAQDVDPGVTADAIWLGAALPLTGPQAALGQLLRDTLQACQSTINTAGGIYGRRLELTVIDAAANSTPTSTARPAFAYLADYDRKNVRQANGTPLLRINPLLSAESHADTDYTVQILPSLQSQARTAVDFMDAAYAHAKPRSLIVTDSDHGYDDLPQAITQQAQKHDWPKPWVHAVGDIRKKWKSHRFDIVFFLGSDTTLQEMVPLLQQRDSEPHLVGLLALTGRAIFSLPERITAKAYLASPFAVTDVDATKRLAQRLQHANVPMHNPGLQATACASVDLFAEAAALTGTRLTTASFLHALQQLADFDAPLLPPHIRFDGHNQGRQGAYIVGIAHQQFVPVGGWIDMRD